MSQLSSSSVLNDEGHHTRTVSHHAGRTRLLDDGETPHSALCSQTRGTFAGATLPSRACASQTLSAPPRPNPRPASDDDAEAATPTRVTRTTLTSSSQHTEDQSNTCLASVRTSEGAAGGSGPLPRCLPSTSTPSSPLTSRTSLRDNAQDTSTACDSHAVSSASTATVHLHHPIVQFLSSVQLQGFAEVLIGAHGVDSMEALLACGRSEDEAGQLLGEGASRQQKLDFWKGLQRWTRDCAREEKRQAKEALRKKGTSATKRGRQAQPEPQPQRHRANTRPTHTPSAIDSATGCDPSDSVFSIDRLCDELLALPSRCPHDAHPPQTTREHDHQDEERSTSTRPVSASQLMRALTLSGDDIAALRAKRHTREPAPSSPRTAHTASGDAAFVDVDAETIASDSDENISSVSSARASESLDWPCQAYAPRPPLPEEEPACAEDAPRQPVVLSAVSDVLSSLAEATCRATVAGLHRPEDGTAQAFDAACALHRANEPVTLCGLYRRSPSLASAVMSQPPEESLTSTQNQSIPTEVPPVEEQEEADEVDVAATEVSDVQVLPSGSLRNDNASLEAQVRSLRAALDDAVAGLVAEYNTALDGLVRRRQDAANAGCSPLFLAPLKAVLVSVEQSADVLPAAPTVEPLTTSTGIARTDTDATLSLSQVGEQDADRSQSVPEATARALWWSAHVNTQRSCEEADEEAERRVHVSLSSVHAQAARTDGDQFPGGELTDEEASQVLHASQTIRFVPSLEPCEPVTVAVAAEGRRSSSYSCVDPEQTFLLTPPAAADEEASASHAPASTTDAWPAVEGSPHTAVSTPPVRSGSDNFWETFGLDALDDSCSSARPALCAAHLSAPALSVPIDVDEESADEVSSQGTKELETALLAAEPSPTRREASCPPSPLPEEHDDDNDNTACHALEDRHEEAVRWLLANGLRDDTLRALSPATLRGRCTALGLRVASTGVHYDRAGDSASSSPSHAASSRTPSSTTATTTTHSAIPFDRFGLDSLNETSVIAPTQLGVRPDKDTSTLLLAGGSLSRSPSPVPQPSGPPGPPRTSAPSASVGSAASTSPAPEEDALGASPRRPLRKRRHREVDLLAAEDDRAQLRLAAVQARFQRLVVPAVLHRVPRFSGLPYHRPRFDRASLPRSDPPSSSALSDSPVAPPSAKAQEHQEMWQCTLAALVADSVEQMEQQALRTRRATAAAPPQPSSSAALDHGPTTAAPLSAMDTLLLLEPLACDRVTALVQRDFAHIARARVRQLIVDSGVSLEVVMAAPTPRTDAPTAVEAPSSPVRAVDALSGGPAASPEQARRANARNYFALRGMPVRGGRRGLWRGRGGRGGGRGMGGGRGVRG